MLSSLILILTATACFGAEVAPGEPLTSWRDTASKKAIVNFVERVTKEGGADFVPPEDRIAMFDNDGTAYLMGTIAAYWTIEPIAGF